MTTSIDKNASYWINRTILVTGGAGCIGSHTVKALQSSGYRVIVLDNLVCGHRDIVENVLKAELLVGDISDRAFLDEVFSTYAIAAVIHFAAYGYVDESVENPAKYYKNNVAAISIFGTDYPTADGTCVRDYLHVSDLARAHILGLEYLLTGADSQIFNLSNGNGVSVRQLIETAEAVTNQPIKVVEEAGRVSDPAVLIGSSDKAFQYLGWEPQYPDLTDIVAHAWQWHQRRHGKIAFSPYLRSR